MEVKVPLVKMDNCDKVSGIFMDIILSLEKDDQKKEIFMVAGLNSKLTILYVEIVSMGSLTSSVVEPREVFRKAIVNSACSIIVCHNHPSGNLDPSAPDRLITDVLKGSGVILNIKLIDHVIIGRTLDDGYYSFKGEAIL